MIKKFKLLKDTPAHKAGLICRQGLNNGKNSHIIYPLNSINRVCETSDITDEWFAPLDFVDENGIDVFKGDNFWIVTDGKLDSHRESYKTGCSYTFVANGQPSSWNGEKFFSTRESAQKWIEECNKSKFVEGEWIYVDAVAGWVTLMRFHSYNIPDEDKFSISEGYTIYPTGEVEITKYENGWPVIPYSCTYSKATPEQIQSILTKVAIYKGFKEGVKYYNAAKTTCNPKGSINILSSSEWEYRSIDDSLFKGCGIGYVYYEGKWATIVEIVPEYVEYIGGIGWPDSYIKIGQVFKTDTECKSSGCKYRIVWTENSGDSIAPQHEKCFKPSTKEAFDLQNSTKEMTITLDGDVVDTSHWGNNVKITYK